jgi:hypothetical protein
MYKIGLICLFTAFLLQGFTQQTFKLSIQPGKIVMNGDGEDYTTLVVTARNGDGEIIPSVNGKVKFLVSSGIVDEPEVNMESGIAAVKFTAPMFGTPVKSSQWMVYFIFRFMEKFISRSGGSTNSASNQKLATDIAMETFREGLNPIALIPKKEGDNFVYIVCDLNGVKGRTKIEISKATDGPNGSIIPGMYYGRDITGQSEWFLDIYSGGEGIFGQANGSKQDANTILFTNESFTEFNDAMGKMAGMGGFMKAYLGPSEKETKYIENYNMKDHGMGSAYMPMPKNGVFVYVPPILFQYAGRKSTAMTSGEPGQEPLKTEKSRIVLSQDRIVGDGRSRTKAVFQYEDEKGVPVSGRAVTWSIPKGLKVISSQTVTDASGNAETVLEAPVIKATDEARGKNSKEVINNYDLFELKAQFTSLKEKPETTQTTLSIYKTLEQNLYILKPGMETSPYKMLLPQLEFYNLESSIFAQVPVGGITGGSQKLALNDAIVFLESREFDREYFQRIYETYFKKDRKMFMSMLENKQGGYSAITDRNGNFKLIIRDFEGKSRLFTGDNACKMAIEPLQAKIADLTGRRSGALTSVLDLLAAGASSDAVALPGSYAGVAMASSDYRQKVLSQIFDMEAILCSGQFEESMGVEEKLHLIGILMTNAKTAAQLMDDTGKEFIGHAWNLFYMLIEVVNEKCKITETVYKAAGSSRPGTYVGNQWSKLDLALASKLAGETRTAGVKRLIRSKLTELLTNTPSADKAKASAGYYRVISNLKETAKGACVNKLIEALSEAFSKVNPLPDATVAIVKNYYYADLRGEVDLLLSQRPERVHAIYSRLQPILRDNSTELRSHYLSIANTRFNAEMYKADWDFFRESVIKGGILAFDVTSGNFGAIKAHMEALDKFNKVTDAAYETTGLLLELWNYSYLWGEAKAGFLIANSSIETGVIKTAEVPDQPGGISLFNSAMAAPPAYAGKASAGLNLVNVDFSLRDGNLPVESFNRAMQAQSDYFSWVETTIYPTGKIIGYNTVLAGNVFKAGNLFDEQFRLMLVNAWGYSVTQSAETRQAYEQSASQFKNTSSGLALSVTKAEEVISKLPAKVMVELPEEPNNSALSVIKNPLYLKIGGGILILTLVVIGTLLFVRRKHRKSLYPPESPPETVVFKPLPFPSSAPGDTPSSPPSASLKFCPQCGSSLKSGAKFCGKCGYKIF